MFLGNWDREVHKVEMVVTKEWRKVKSADAGICIRFSCRDNSSFRLNSLGPLCLWQFFRNNLLLNLRVRKAPGDASDFQCTRKRKL